MVRTRRNGRGRGRCDAAGRHRGRRRRRRRRRVAVAVAAAAAAATTAGDFRRRRQDQLVQLAADVDQEDVLAVLAVRHRVLFGLATLRVSRGRKTSGSSI